MWRKWFYFHFLDFSYIICDITFYDLYHDAHGAQSHALAHLRIYHTIPYHTIWSEGKAKLTYPLTHSMARFMWDTAPIRPEGRVIVHDLQVYTIGTYISPPPSSAPPSPRLTPHPITGMFNLNLDLDPDPGSKTTLPPSRPPSQKIEHFILHLQIANAYVPTLCRVYTLFPSVLCLCALYMCIPFPQ